VPTPARKARFQTPRGFVLAQPMRNGSCDGGAHQITLRTERIASSFSLVDAMIRVWICRDRDGGTPREHGDRPRQVVNQIERSS
jgi:hypothetical protein